MGITNSNKVRLAGCIQTEVYHAIWYNRAGFKAKLREFFKLNPTELFLDIKIAPCQEKDGSAYGFCVNIDLKDDTNNICVPIEYDHGVIMIDRKDSEACEKLFQNPTDLHNVIALAGRELYHTIRGQLFIPVDGCQLLSDGVRYPVKLEEIRDIWVK